jgi:hypothetical protein
MRQCCGVQWYKLHLGVTIESVEVRTRSRAIQMTRASPPSLAKSVPGGGGGGGGGLDMVTCKARGAGLRQHLLPSVQGVSPGSIGFGIPWLYKAFAPCVGWVVGV